MPVWFYRATPFMGRRFVWRQLRAMARCSRSTLMARVLRPCIVSLAGKRRRLSVCRSGFIGQHSLWDGVWRSGSPATGTVFGVNTNGTGFTNLHSFTAGRCFFTNSDGDYPYGRFDFIGQHPLWDGGLWRQRSGIGTVFGVNTNGTDFTNLHSFTNSHWKTGVNSDGASPVGRFDFIGQHPVWDGGLWRHYGRWHGVRGQHRWLGFYDPV